MGNVEVKRAHEFELSAEHQHISCVSLTRATMNKLTRGIIEGEAYAPVPCDLPMPMRIIIEIHRRISTFVHGITKAPENAESNSPRFSGVVYESSEVSGVKVGRVGWAQLYPKLNQRLAAYAAYKLGAPSIQFNYQRWYHPFLETRIKNTITTTSPMREHLTAYAHLTGYTDVADSAGVIVYYPVPYDVFEIDVCVTTKYVPSASTIKASIKVGACPWEDPVCMDFTYE